MNFKPSNVFQVSTLKALVVVLSAFGIGIPDEVVSGLSTGVLSLWGIWEAMRDGKQSK